MKKVSVIIFVIIALFCIIHAISTGNAEGIYRGIIGALAAGVFALPALISQIIKSLHKNKDKPYEQPIEEKESEQEIHNTQLKNELKCGESPMTKHNPIAKIAASIIVAVLCASIVFFVCAMNFSQKYTKVETQTTYKSVETYVCFVTKNSEHYHTFDCKYINEKDKIQTTVYEATQEGRFPCSYCNSTYNYSPSFKCDTEIKINVPYTVTKSVETVHPHWQISVNAAFATFVVCLILFLIISFKPPRSQANTLIKSKSTLILTVCITVGVVALIVILLYI